MQEIFMNLLALDFGCTTGYAILHNEKILSGTRSFKQKRLANGGLRFLKFRNWLIKIIPDYGIEKSFYEDVKRHLGTDAAHVYGGYLYHLAVVCEEFHIPYFGLPVGSIKKAATGNGRASKDEMIQSVKAAGFAPCDHNEADALAILFLALRKSNLELKEKTWK
jgi:Holliday junction resolvasome RuvABC endonuclease subunit